MNKRVNAFKASHAELIDARKRRTVVISGSDEEYYRQQVRAFYEHKDLRDAANIAVLGYTF